MKTEEEKEMLVLVELEDFLKRRFSLTQVIQISEPDLYKALCNVYSFSQGTMEGEGAFTQNCHCSTLKQSCVRDAVVWNERTWGRSGI